MTDKRTNNMKNKIFNKMIEYGWNLGDNAYKEFDKVFNYHFNFIDDLYCYFEGDENCKIKDIDNEELKDMATFISDFLRAINDIDKEEKGKK